MMSGIRGKDTAPELRLRSLLHRAGFRFALHDPSLPGRPDIKLTRYSAVIQVQGCFWHGHDCPLFKLPESNAEFWQVKIASNQARDMRNEQLLRERGWRLLTVWECALRRPGLPDATLVRQVTRWIKSGAPSSEIRGQPKLT
jgi:DNA mismatch endonuclease, patch repair protein